MVENIFTVLLVLGVFAILVSGLSIQGVIPFFIFLVVVASGIYGLSRVGWLAVFRKLISRNRPGY